MTIEIELPQVIYDILGGNPGQVKKNIVDTISNYCISEKYNLVHSQVQTIYDNAKNEIEAELNNIVVTNI